LSFVSLMKALELYIFFRVKQVLCKTVEKTRSGQRKKVNASEFLLPLHCNDFVLIYSPLETT
jgi:hypothetical protein